MRNQAVNTMLFMLAVLAVFLGAQVLKIPSPQNSFSGALIALAGFAGTMLLLRGAKPGNDFNLEIASCSFWSVKMALVCAVAYALALYFSLRFFKSNNNILFMIYMTVALFQLVFIVKVMTQKQNKKVPVLVRKNSKNQPKSAKTTIFLVLVIAVLIAEYLLLKKTLITYFFPLFVIGAFALSYTAKESGIAVSTEQDSKGLQPVPWLLFGIFAVALLVRLFRFTEIPPGYDYDVRRILDVAYKVRAGEKLPVFLPDMDLNIGFLNYYIYFLWYKVAGFKLESLRIFSGIVNALQVFTVYALVKEMFNKRAALLSAFFVSFFFIALEYSGKTPNPTMSSLTTILALLCLVKGLKKGLPAYFVAAGLLLGITQYSYNVVKVVPLIIVVFYLYLISMKEYRQQAIRLFPVFLLLVAAALTVFSPMIGYILKNPDNYLLRVKNAGLSGGPGGFAAVLSTVVSQSYDFVYLYTSKNGQYGYPLRPLVTPWASLFFLAGLAYFFGTWKNKNSFLILSAFVLSHLPAVLSTYNVSPNIDRAIMAIPYVPVIIGVGADVLWRIAEKFRNRAVALAAPILILVLLSFSAVSDLKTYFTDFPKNPSVMLNYEYAASTAEKIIKKYPGSNAYVSTFIQSAKPFFGIDITASRSEYCDFSAFSLSSIYNNSGKGVLLLGEALYLPYLESLTAFFPGVQQNRVGNHERLMFWTDVAAPDTLFAYAYIPYTEIEKTFGLSAEYFFGKTPVRSGTVKNTVLDFGTDADMAVVSGFLYAPEYGDYVINESAGCDAVIDGVPVADSKLRLYKGPHRVSLKIRKSAGGKAALAWKPPSSQAVTEIGTQYLFTNGSVNGLMADYAYGTGQHYYELQATPFLRMYDFFPKYPGANPFSVTWRGKIMITEDGDYEFLAGSPFETVIVINGRKLQPGGKLEGGTTFGPIALKAGTYPLTVTYDNKKEAKGRQSFYVKYRHNAMYDYEFIPAEKLRP